MNADTTGKTQITFGDSTDYSPAWSPTYKKVVFSTNRRGAYELFTVNADGTGLSPLTTAGKQTYDVNPSWAPDGKKIAVVRLPLGAAWDQARLYTMNTDGTGIAVLTGGWTGDAEPAWSPEGSKVAFTCHEGFPDYRDICTVNADGTDRKYIVMWQGQQANPTFLRDGARIVFESYATGIGMLFSVKPDGTGSVELLPLDRNAYYSAAWSR